MPMPTPILIAGPTASGKSALAVALARRLDGAVVNADSMQVYADLTTLTARPGVADLAQAPHRLYGHIAATTAYSVGSWIEDVSRILAELDVAKRRPIIVGGTGLYFEVLLNGLSPVPDIPADVRAHWRAEADRLGPERLHDVLARQDAEMAARLRPSDPQRVTRALEVIAATGRSLAEWQRETSKPLLRADDVVRIVLRPERDALHGRCDRRFDAMLADRVLDEVSRLLALGLDHAKPIMRATGVVPLRAHLEGRLSLADAVLRAKADTRHYAKRQMTWARGRMAGWRQLSGSDPDRSADAICERLPADAKMRGQPH